MSSSVDFISQPWKLAVLSTSQCVSLFLCFSFFDLSPCIWKSVSFLAISVSFYMSSCYFCTLGKLYLLFINLAFWFQVLYTPGNHTVSHIFYPVSLSFLYLKIGSFFNSPSPYFIMKPTVFWSVCNFFSSLVNFSVLVTYFQKVVLAGATMVPRVQLGPVPPHRRGALSPMMKEISQRRNFLDLTLRCDDGFFSVHRVLVSAQSKVGILWPHCHASPSNFPFWWCGSGRFCESLPKTSK